METVLIGWSDDSSSAFRPGQRKATVLADVLTHPLLLSALSGRLEPGRDGGVRPLRSIVGNARRSKGVVSDIRR